MEALFTGLNSRGRSEFFFLTEKFPLLKIYSERDGEFSAFHPFFPDK
jgi:hypothetical protein